MDAVEPQLTEAKQTEAQKAAPSDSELVRRVKQGDRAAFDELMRRHQREIIGVAYRLLWNYQDALEVAQEAFLRMYRGLPGFREEAAFRTWAYQITLNLVRHRRRWHARHRTADTASIDAPADGEDDPPFDQIPDSKPDPRDEAGRSELRAAVRRAIADLPVPFRTVVALRDIQGLSYEEIASICRERVGTVKSRLHRARAMLRGLLEKAKC